MKPMVSSSAITTGRTVTWFHGCGQVSYGMWLVPCPNCGLVGEWSNRPQPRPEEATQ